MGNVFFLKAKSMCSFLEIKKKKFRKWKCKSQPIKFVASNARFAIPICSHGETYFNSGIRLFVCGNFRLKFWRLNNLNKKKFPLPLMNEIVFVCLFFTSFMLQLFYPWQNSWKKASLIIEILFTVSFFIQSNSTDQRKQTKKKDFFLNNQISFQDKQFLFSLCLFCC